MQHRQHLRLVEVVDAEHLLDLENALVGEHRRAGFLVEPIVAGLLDPLGGLALGALVELRNHPVHHRVEVGVLLRSSGDDERRPRFVDQDGVDLVDDRVGEVPLHAVVEGQLHVVAQVVEAQLVVGRVGDVRPVGLHPLLIGEVVDDDAYGEPEEAVDLAHPLRVAAREVVVHGDDVDALARKRVQIAGQRGDEGLALAGLHLGDGAAMQDDAADQLDVVMALAQRALGSLAHRREGLGEQVVEGLSLRHPLAKDRGLAAQIRVGERHELRLELVDALHEGRDPLDQPVVGAAEDFSE
jgi:hypothetical protein